MAAKKTTSKKVETPEEKAAEIKRLAEKGLRLTDDYTDPVETESRFERLQAEIDRLNWVVRQKDLAIDALKKANEQISDELSKERFK